MSLAILVDLNLLQDQPPILLLQHIFALQHGKSLEVVADILLHCLLTTPTLPRLAALLLACISASYP